MAKKKTTSKPKKKKTPVVFEQALEELRAVVIELENGNLTLSDSLEKYEQGVANLKQCYDALNQAQRKIELLINLDEDGNLATRPFDDAATHELDEEIEDEIDDEIDETESDEQEFDETDTLF